MNKTNKLLSLFKILKSEYALYYKNLLIPTLNTQKIKSIEIIKKLFELIQLEINDLRNMIECSYQIKCEQEKSIFYNDNAEKIQLLFNTANNALTEGIPFFNMSSTNEKYHINYISPKDLVNFSFRVNKEYSFPPDMRNISSIPFAFLHPYPHEDQEFKSSILKFRLADQKRTQPPNVIPSGGLVKKGTILKITYIDDTEQNHEIFFKYTMHGDAIPSYFSGELYKESNPIILDKKTIIKICSCRPGYKDSLITTHEYEVTSEEIENPEIKPIENQMNQNIVVRPELEISKVGEKYVKVSLNNEDIRSSAYSPGGSSAYHASLYKKESSEFDSDEI